LQAWRVIAGQQKLLIRSPSSTGPSQSKAVPHSAMSGENRAAGYAVSTAGNQSRSGTSLHHIQIDSTTIYHQRAEGGRRAPGSSVADPTPERSQNSATHKAPGSQGPLSRLSSPRRRALKFRLTASGHQPLDERAAEVSSLCNSTSVRGISIRQRIGTIRPGGSPGHSRRQSR
jgi:hypothetical protein